MPNTVGSGQLLWVLNQYLPTFVGASWLASSELAYYAAAHRVVFGLGSWLNDLNAGRDPGYIAFGIGALVMAFTLFQWYGNGDVEIPSASPDVPPPRISAASAVSSK